MKSWLVLPRDPLIFRDGRPFHAVPGARARSLPFPHPSTLIGAVRTRAGTNGNDRFDAGRIPELKQKRLLGPVLVKVNDQGIDAWYFPAPADTLLVGKEEPLRRYWLRPVTVPSGIRLTMPNDLTPVGAHQDVKDKPARHAPSFWKWDALRSWLLNPIDEDEVTAATLGISDLPVETRVHVHIDRSKGTAREGFLFQTSGRWFLHRKEPDTFIADTYGLLLWTDADFAPGPGFLGGERRVVYWQQVNVAPPDVPSTLLQSAKEHQAVRLALVTPAFFEQGYLPGWLTQAVPGVRVDVVAVALPKRPVAVSGWDMENQREKPTRLLVPAGTVYYLRLQGSEKAIEDFVRTVWFHPISDDDQARRDGFGLTLVGTWNGQLASWEVES